MYCLMVFAEEIHAFAYMLLFLRAGVRRFYIRLKIEGELRAINPFKEGFKPRHSHSSFRHSYQAAR